MKKLVLFCILAASVKTSVAQFVLSAETGFTTGGRKEYTFKHTNDFQEATKTEHVRSPLLGAHADYYTTKYMFFSTGIQYQQKKEKDVRDFTHFTPNHAFTTKQWSETVFNKICFPVSAGVIFNFGPIRPAFFAGVRPNLFFAARHDETFMEMNGPNAGVAHESSYNPLWYTATRMGFNAFGQLFCGASVMFVNRFKVSFMVTRYNQIAFTYGPMSCYAESISNRDNVFTFAWIFGAKDKTQTKYNTVRNL